MSCIDEMDICIISLKNSFPVYLSHTRKDAGVCINTLTSLHKAAYISKCGIKLNLVHGIVERVKRQNLVKTHKIDCKQFKLEKMPGRQT
jgi:lipoate-protein ligase B